MTARHRGTCFCEEVEIQALGQPIDMGYCHCTSCRRYCGAPFVAFTIWPRADVEFVRGSELVGRFNKVGTSERQYCKACGGHLLLDHTDLGVVDIRAAVLPSVVFRPVAHLNYAEAVIRLNDDLPKFRDLPVEIGGTGELICG
jgi:hypothetical protein